MFPVGGEEKKRCMKTATR